MVLRAYQRIIDTAEPYLIARPPVMEDADRSPFRIPIPDENIFDPQRMAGRVFINMVKHLDEMAYGPLGLSMPSWVFYDCAVMPGAIFGFARRAADLPRWIRQVLKVPSGYEGLVPLSMFISIPMADRKGQLAYTLCSINQVAPGAAPEGLWRVTLALGTRCLGVSEMVGTCQWRSPRLGLYAGLGPLQLLTAWTPAHDNYATCTFRVRTDATARARLLRGDMVGAEGIDHYLDADDVGALQDLQDQIEAGTAVAVVGPAEIRGSETRIPIQMRGEGMDFDTDVGPGFTRRFQG